MLLVIDNYDSFTYNLVQYLSELAAQGPTDHPIQVYRNDQIDLPGLRRLNPAGVVLSPGPGRPESAGICLDLLRELGPRLPLLGVCLGHQSLGQAFGARVVRAETLMHGKTSEIYHHGVGLFQGLATPFTATRYHSLVVERATLPDCLEVTAWLADGTIMGLRHRDYPHLQGVQFHPESVLTTLGKPLLQNFLMSLPAAPVATRL